MTSVAAAAPSERRAGTYLTFALQEVIYALPVLEVRQIINTTSVKLTIIPRAPAHVKGVMNLRGEVIPVVDLRSKLGIAGHQPQDHTCIIVVNPGRTTFGLIVDRVCEVQDIPAENIEDTSSFALHTKAEGIRGIAKVDSRVVMLLRAGDLFRHPTADDGAPVPGTCSTLTPAETSIGIGPPCASTPGS